MCSIERLFFHKGELMANIAEVLRELQQERDRLDQAITALQPLAGNSTTTQAGAVRASRTVSAAARRRMAAAQRARWAKTKSASKQPSSTPSNKRVLSAASRKKISAAKKAWWAKQKKAA